jgi:hypothetical protein
MFSRLGAVQVAASSSGQADLDQVVSAWSRSTRQTRARCSNLAATPLTVSHGNAYTSWLRMGSPASPNKAQVDRLHRAAQTTAQPIWIRHRGDRATLVRRLPLQSVELIEIPAGPR